MQEIKCPKCGEVFTIDEAGYAAIVKQVRDKEFARDLKAQSETAVRLAEAEKDRKIDELRHALEDAQVQNVSAVKLAEAEKDRKIDELRHALEDAQAQNDSAVKLAEAEKDRRIAELEGRLSAAEKDKDLAVKDALDAMKEEAYHKDAQIASLKSNIRRMADEFALKSDAAEKDAERRLREKDEQIAYYKDWKLRLSTKMIGESLEQHCETEFNTIRPTAFPFAYFEKDNDAKGGSKGDYVFRDYDADGTEYISIMFEMKNEMDETASKHKNEEFFKKLDRDRTEKGCEYAVLVSMLEADSEYYNTGIVDVSHRYPKMYVVRPQFFLPIISLLRNAAKNTLEYRRQLTVMRNQDLDLQKFEDNMEQFKADFLKSVGYAKSNHEKAVKNIDKAIDALQEIKRLFETSDMQLDTANGKVEKLSIKRLTKGNPTMKEKFLEAGIEIK